jgi:hypothetical protein
MWMAFPSNGTKRAGHISSIPGAYARGNTMKFQLPWISRRRHEEALKALEESYRKNDELQLRCIDRLAHERDKAWIERDETRNELAPTLNRIAERIARPEWEYRPDNRRIYRAVIDFDEDTIHKIFEWGSDDEAIRQIGEMIGRQAASVIREMNRRREPIPDTARFIPRNGSPENPYE